MSDPVCLVCAAEHAPLDSNRRYYYASTAGSDAHTAETEWYAKHGVQLLHGMTSIEAQLQAVAPAAADLHLNRRSPRPTPPDSNRR